jgi:hypothetical protein
MEGAGRYQVGGDLAESGMDQYLIDARRESDPQNMRVARARTELAVQIAESQTVMAQSRALLARLADVVNGDLWGRPAVVPRKSP